MTSDIDLPDWVKQAIYGIVVIVVAVLAATVIALCGITVRYLWNIVASM